ncbi:unnamed protein product [Cyclocybe aegerita]|uniref:Major facilitator superfamily (MFS) profile domain-containing protein n=1 Tax=Cyclocybe aegerita TaxID=1973307 RepID=A0A8S0VYG5_CYCAE|nr:unnamed protein product [Cyclocybe aegerita]
MSADEPPNSIKTGQSKPQQPHRGWRFWLIFLALCLCTIVAALDMGSMATALPVIAHELGGTQSFVWVLSVYPLASAAIIPLSGRLAEVFGRRHIILFSLFVFAVGSLVCAVAHTMAMLIIGRAIQGIGSGIIQTLTTILSNWNVGWVGPFVGGAIVEKTTWRWLFYINLPICSLAFTVVFIFFHMKRPGRQSFKQYIVAMDLIGNAMIILSTTSCILALTWGGVQHPWVSAQVLAPLFIGILALVLSIVYEIRFASHPTIPFQLLANRTSLSGYFGSFVHGFVITCVTFYLPVYFQAAKALPPLLSGLYVFPTVIVISPSAVVQGLFIAKFGHYRNINLIGWSMMLLGIGLLSLLKPLTPIGVSVPFQIIASIGFGFLFATTFAVLAPLDVTLNAAALAFLTFIRTLPQPWGATIGATIIQNDLKKHLPPVFVKQFTSDSDLTYVAIPTIPRLDQSLRTQVEDAYARSLRLLWLVMLGLCAVGFLSVFAQEEIPLHTQQDSKWGMKDLPKQSAEISKAVGTLFEKVEENVSVEEPAPPPTTTGDV